LRNPRTHREPATIDPLIAIAEMVTASALLRTIESALDDRD